MTDTQPIKSIVPIENPARQLSKPDIFGPVPPVPHAESNLSGSVFKSSRAFQDELNLERAAITGLNGKTCKLQPKLDELPSLHFGGKLEGCHYETGNAEKSLEAHGLDLGAAYKNALRETVYIATYARKNHKTEGYTGSGVVVGQTENKTYILTDDHVVDLTRAEGKVSSRTVTGNNGEYYTAKVVARDAKADRALMEIDIGTRFTNYFHVATIAQDGATTKKNAPIVFAGFPEATTSLYLSPGKAHSIHYQEFSDDIARRTINLHAKGSFGNSGGPVYNTRHEVIGLIEGGSKKDMEATILSKELVDRWLKPHGLLSK